MQVGLVRGVVLGALLAFSGCDETASADVTQVGYFKSAENDRVMAFRSDAPLTQEDAEAVVAAQVFTAGRLGRVVFYSGADTPVPGDALTLAETLGAALEITATAPYDGWDWSLSINPAGARSWKSNLK